MINGQLRGQVDAIWNAFWSGGISNPAEVVEQITYLLFMRRLEQRQILAENKARRTGTPIEEPVFLPDEQHLRWSSFKGTHPEDMFETVSREVFPFLQLLGERLGTSESSYARNMRGARFTIPTPALLAKVVDMMDRIELTDHDTSGDLYEYLLSKLASAGVNGQFRTPRHIIDLMVAMRAPRPDDIIVDPACGTAGFLVQAQAYVRHHHPEAFTDASSRTHFHRRMFHGYDFDATMLRIASMNMLMHGVNDPGIEYRDSLSEDWSDDSGAYTLVLANPPFKGSLDADVVARNLTRVASTKKTELLFLALFLRMLRPGGRAAVIVPDGVLFGSTKAHKALRRVLVEDQKLEGVVSLPSGVFKPYAGVSTAILLFTRTDSGGTEDVWFYDVRADGFSLDDKRAPVDTNDLPDVLTRWERREDDERERHRTEQSFCVPRQEIADNDYDLSLNRYKEVVIEEVAHRSPAEILDEIEALEKQITEGTRRLREMLA